MPLWLAAEPLVLASKSEVRRLILANAGIPVETQPADIDERGIEASATTRDPGGIAALLAREKACAIAMRFPNRLVLGADQTLALGQQRFSKPVGRDGARAQLKALCGQTHALHSAIALMHGDALVFEHRDVARLTMRAFSDQFLEAYLDAVGAAVSASVGGYQLENLGIELFERVEGSHFTILGLPILALLEHLRRTGQLAA